MELKEVDNVPECLGNMFILVTVDQPEFFSCSPTAGFLLG